MSLKLSSNKSAASPERVQEAQDKLARLISAYDDIPIFVCNNLTLEGSLELSGLYSSDLGKSTVLVFNNNFIGSDSSIVGPSKPKSLGYRPEDTSADEKGGTV